MGRVLKHRPAKKFSSRCKGERHYARSAHTVQSRTKSVLYETFIETYSRSYFLWTCLRGSELNYIKRFREGQGQAIRVLPENPRTRTMEKWIEVRDGYQRGMDQKARLNELGPTRDTEI